MNSKSSKSRLRRNVRLWQTLWLLALIAIGIFFVNNGCVCAKREIVYLNDSQRIKVLEPNEPAPFKGVLITLGRHEYLLDCEGKIQ